MSHWLRLACHRATVRRALLTALVVGPVLVAINQGDALLAGHLSGLVLARIALTFAVPYIVSTISSVATRREVGQ